MGLGGGLLGSGHGVGTDVVVITIVGLGLGEAVTLCTGWAAGLILVTALANARGERTAGATGLGRVAWAACLSSSVNSRGASRACMCQLM